MENRLIFHLLGIFIFIVLTSLQIGSSQVTIGEEPKDVSGVIISSIKEVKEFLDLDDTPSSYEGFADNCVIVNSSENGLEFIPCNATTSNSSIFADIWQTDEGDKDNVIDILGSEITNDENWISSPIDISQDTNLSTDNTINQSKNILGINLSNSNTWTAETTFDAVNLVMDSDANITFPEISGKISQDTGSRQLRYSAQFGGDLITSSNVVATWDRNSDFIINPLTNAITDLIVRGSAISRLIEIDSSENLVKFINGKINITEEGYQTWSNMLVEMSETNGGQVIGTDWINITFDKFEFNDSLYKILDNCDFVDGACVEQNPHAINLTTAGRYRIDAMLGADISSGTDRSGTEIRLVELDQGGAFNVIAASGGSAYQRISAVGKDSAYVFDYFDADKGDIIMLQARKYTGTSTIIIDANKTKLGIERR